jgi:hypothetical protein
MRTRTILDLELRYRPASEVNLARFDLWAAQLVFDAAAGDGAAVRGRRLHPRLHPGPYSPRMNPEAFTALNIQLGRLQIASVDGALARAARAAMKLRAVTAGLA